MADYHGNRIARKGFGTPEDITSIKNVFWLDPTMLATDIEYSALVATIRPSRRRGLRSFY